MKTKYRFYLKGAFVTAGFCLMMGNGELFANALDSFWVKTAANNIWNRYTSNGVSIGTTNPPGSSSKLQVNGGAAIGYSTSQAVPSSGLMVSGSVGVGTNPGAKLHVVGSAGSNTFVVGTATAANGGVVIKPEYGTGIASIQGTNSGLTAVANLAINPEGGNVGIGTAIATEKLHIANAAGGVEIKMENNSNSAYLRSYADRFNIYLTMAPQHEVLTILQSNGRVGIGTPSPQSLLAVNGTITTKEVVVTATGWPDNVFKKDYALKPLNEVENFIKTHRHLEGIPTEKDVKAKGVAMGDMQTKLLKKVEELTMYAIAEDKKIEAQNKKIEALIKANEELSIRLDQDKEK